MAFERDYDEAVQGLEEIRVKLAGRFWEFAGDPPANVAIEWYRKNTRFDPNVNIGDRTEDNWKLVFGEVQYAEMIEAGATAKKMDALYTDLLDLWHIVRQPKRHDTGGVSDEFWNEVQQLPEQYQTEIRLYMIGLETRVDELEDLLGLEAESAEEEDVPAGEASG